MDNDKLLDIRQKIDIIDTQIHNLLIDRADIVDDIIAIKKSEAEQHNTVAVTYHPAREALLLKNILKNHCGNLPYSSIIEIWRSLLAAFCGMQCDFSIAYFDNAQDSALRDLLRYYFGSLVELHQSNSECSVLDDVSDAQTVLAVLPVINNNKNVWWLNFPEKCFVSGVLPYVQNDPIVRTSDNYMIISQTKPVETDHDKSLFKITSDLDVSCVSMMKYIADLQHQAQSLCIVDNNNLSQRYHLIEIDDFFQESYIQDFIDRFKLASDGKILDIQYLGSYPAPINLQDFKA